MTARRPLDALGRALWIALTTAALLLRIAIPSGWMPMESATGVHLLPCPGATAGAPVTAGGMMMAMPSHTGHHPSHGDPSNTDHPCDFAGMALALATPPPPAVDAPRPAAFVPTAVSRAAGWVGRGLAAPPPPSTGPPLLG